MPRPRYEEYDPNKKKPAPPIERDPTITESGPIDKNYKPHESGRDPRPYDRH